ncbi:MAG: inositol monophosphatase family protein [Luminiphilus sp.]|nr:inositol monophosphatase family protein [Luminiphilus sp.]
MEPTATMALRAARKAGDLIVRASDDMDRVGYQAKAAADFVTEVDIAAEKEILYQLGKAYPEHRFLCEESGLSGNEDSDYTWVIDPLDGTSNFLRGIPHYAISIACLHRGKIEHAVVYDPVRREEFIASRGRGAQLNDHRIRVGSRHELNDSLIGTGVPFMGHCDEHLDWYTQSLAAITSRSMGVRRAGAASLDLAYVAASRLDGFWEMGLNRWDIAAGALLVREAGGLITDLSGGEGWYHSGNVVCANSKLMRQILPLVKWTAA